MITLDGERVKDSWEYPQFEAILRELEIIEHLKTIASSKEKTRSKPTHGQVQRWKREQKEYSSGIRSQPPSAPVSEKLQDLIAASTADQPTLTVFLGRLQQQGVEVRIKSTRNQVIQGISYSFEGVKFPGNQLHHCSFSKLITERGVSYDVTRDESALKAISQGKIIQLNPEQSTGNLLPNELPQIKSLDHEKLQIKSSQNEQLQVPQSVILPSATIITPEGDNLTNYQAKNEPNNKEDNYRKQPQELIQQIAPTVAYLLQSTQMSLLVPAIA
jgi:hypothetical protein